MRADSQIPLLANVPSPHRLESIQGYACRVSEANGLPRVEDLSKVDGFREYLSGLVGHPLIGYIPKWLRSELRSTDASRVLSVSFTLTARVRWCPLCLDEQMFWRGWWEHRLYASCHIHGIQMFETCPVCEAQLKWQNFVLGRCMCGAYLHRFRGNSVAISDLEAARAIYRAISGESDSADDRAQKRHESMLDVLSLSGVEQLICRLGCLSAATDDYVGTKRWRTLSVEQVGQLIAVAGEHLSDWPSHFHDLLRQDAEHQIPPHVAHQLVKFRSFLNRRLPSELSFLKDGYVSFQRNEARRLIDRRNPWATPEDIESQQYVAAAVAARRVGVRAATLHALADHADVRMIEKTVADGTQVCAVRPVDYSAPKRCAS